MIFSRGRVCYLVTPPPEGACPRPRRGWTEAQVRNATLDPAVAAELRAVAVTGGNGTPSTGTRSCPCKSAGNASTALSKTVLKVILGLRLMALSPCESLSAQSVERRSRKGKGRTMPELTLD